MAAEAKIPGTAEAWESGELGQDEKFVRRASTNVKAKIDEALGLQAISIRLPKAVIETYKMLATVHGVGYQPLMRDALCRFAESETKQLLAGAIEAQRQQATHKKQAPHEPAKQVRRVMKKAA